MATTVVVIVSGPRADPAADAPGRRGRSSSCYALVRGPRVQRRRWSIFFGQFMPMAIAVFSMARHGRGPGALSRRRGWGGRPAAASPCSSPSCGRRGRSSSTGASFAIVWTFGFRLRQSGAASPRVDPPRDRRGGRRRGAGDGRRDRGAHPDRPRSARHRRPLGHLDGRAGGRRRAGRRRRPGRTPARRSATIRDDRHAGRWRTCGGWSRCCATPTSPERWRRSPECEALPALVDGRARRRAGRHPGRRGRGPTAARGRRRRGVPDRAGGADERRAGTRGLVGRGSDWTTATTTLRIEVADDGVGAADPQRRTRPGRACGSARRSTAAGLEAGSPNGSGFVVRAVLPAVHAVSDAALRVVVVDDQELVRSGFALILEQAGMDVVGQAADGLEALEVVADATARRGADGRADAAARRDRGDPAPGGGAPRCPGARR